MTNLNTSSSHTNEPKRILDLNQPRIIIVEDELLIAETLSRKLTKLGFNVIQIITSGEEAITAAAEQKPDLIMMDIVIRGSLDGIEAASIIYEKYCIPIIFLSAYADDETLERAEMTGCYGYLLKPVKERELKASIRVALQKHLQDQRFRTFLKSAQETLKLAETISSPKVMSLQEDLTYALDRQELTLYYQPLIHIESRQIIGAEALLRWKHPRQGMISPATFIPIAESSGLIIEIGEWVLRTACFQARDWMNTKTNHPFTMAVNVSAHQFRPNFIPMLQSILEESQIPPHCLSIELTENILIDQSPEIIDMIQKLKTFGVSLSVDDFGTGYSSMSYLQYYPFNTLKIDRCFIQNINKNPENIFITKAIIEMAQGLNLKLVAEGVELEDELKFLEENHCDIAQGYLFSPPVPAAKFERIAFSRTLKPSP